MTEYPFKDLLPIDEVLEREGYYNDWTHLDPKVFYSLTQISEYIKTKGYGVDVRLLIAQLAEHFGLKTTQVIDLANLLQQQFTDLEGVTQSFTNNINSLVAQMEAEKDAVIANVTVDSEVILARGESDTLGDRLNRIEYKEYVQYYVESPDRLPSASEISLKGFYYDSDDGRTSKYTITNLDGNEVVHTIVNDTLTYEITENLEIIIGSKKLIPRFKQRLHGRYVGLGSDDDTQVFELLMEYAHTHEKHVDLSNIAVTILGTVFLNKPQYPRDLLMVFDGEIRKPNAGLAFDTKVRTMSGGGYKWINTKFVGIDRSVSMTKEEADLAPKMSLFDTAIIRNYFTNAEFLNVDRLLDSRGNDFFAQTIYLNNPHIVGGLGTFIEVWNAYDISVSQGLVEHRWNFMDIKTPNSVRIIDNVIEGMNGFVFKGFFGRGLQIKDNYFEANCRKTDEPYFDFETTGSTISNRSFTFTGNLIQDNPDKTTRPEGYAIVNFDRPPSGFDLGGNWSDTKLYNVAKFELITNTLVRNVMTNQVMNGAPVLNQWQPTDVLEGSGGRLSYNIDSSVDDFTASEGATMRKIGQGIELTLPPSGRVVTTSGFMLPPREIIALGVSVYKISTNTGDLVFKIRKYDGTEIEVYRLPFDKMSNRFYTMPPYTHTGSQDNFKIIITAEGNTTDLVFTISHLVVQAGTIANP